MQLPLIEPTTLRRAEALERLAPFMGKNLRDLAATYQVTVWRAGRRNKGWAGQTIERLLGMPNNSDQAADFGDWELKVVPLVPAVQTGGWRLKESMAITMLNLADLEEQPFEDSHLLAKLSRLLVVGRSYEGPSEARSLLLGAAAFDLDDPALYAAIEEDYDEIRWVARTEGIHALTGRIGQYVQPRPKGGKDAETMGFYARKALVGHILGMDR